MDKIFHMKVTYSIKRYKKNMQHQDLTNTKQLWQQQRFSLGNTVKNNNYKKV